jgi:hypothetical protein
MCTAARDEPLKTSFPPFDGGRSRDVGRIRGARAATILAHLWHEINCLEKQGWLTSAQASLLATLAERL